jgi:hypothetical protein
VAQRDTVLRWIEQLGRLVARLMGTGKGADLALAQAEIAAAVESLLGPLALLVPRLEAASAADLLRDTDRIYAYAQLLSLQAALARASNDAAGAAQLQARAAAIGEEAVARAPEVPDSWREWLAAQRDAS